MNPLFGKHDESAPADETTTDDTAAASERPAQNVAHDDTVDDDPIAPAHDEQGTMVPADSPMAVSYNVDNVNVDPGPGDQTEESTADYQYADEDNLPRGTAYVTPNGVMGVIGDYEDPARPLYGANIEALFALSGEIRKESSYR